MKQRAPLLYFMAGILVISLGYYVFDFTSEDINFDYTFRGMLCGFLGMIWAGLTVRGILLSNFSRVGSWVLIGLVLLLVFILIAGVFMDAPWESGSNSIGGLMAMWLGGILAIITQAVTVGYFMWEFFRLRVAERQSLPVHTK